MHREIHYFGNSVPALLEELTLILRLLPSGETLVYTTEVLDISLPHRFFISKREMLLAYLSDIGSTPTQICIYDLRFDIALLVKSCEDEEINIPSALGDGDKSFTFEVKKKKLKTWCPLEPKSVENSFGLVYSDILIHIHSMRKSEEIMPLYQAVGVLPLHPEKSTRNQRIAQTILKLESLWTIIDTSGKYQLPYLKNNTF